MALPNGYRLRRINLTFTLYEIRAAGVETAAGWGVNWTGGFTRDNFSLLMPVRRVGRGDSLY